MEKPPYRTIKTSLRSIVKNEEFHQKINALVLRINPIVIDTYQFIRLYCLDLYHRQEPIPDLDAKFISYCMSAMGTRDARGGKKAQPRLQQELDRFYEKEFRPIFNHTKFDLKLLSRPLGYIQTNMETSLVVNVKEHFAKRLLRFINIFASRRYDEVVGGEQTEEYIKTRRTIIRKLKNAMMTNKPDDVPPCLYDWFIMHRPKLYPEHITKTIPYDCQVQPWRYISPSIYMNQCYEEYNATAPGDKLIKLFQPLSLRSSCIPKYITLDTTTLIALFAEKGTKETLLKKICDNQEQVWATHFEMAKKIFKSKAYVFNYTLQTDGMGASILFKHKSLVGKKYGARVKTIDNSIPYIDDCSNDQFEALKTKKIVTADPGKLYLLYMVDDEGNELKYSCKQRDTESLAKCNRRIRQMNKKNSGVIHQRYDWFPDVIACETELSDYSSSTVDIQKFKDFMKKKHEINVKVGLYYEDMINRKLNWRTKVHRQKSEDKFMHRIQTKFGEDIVVCIGDWSAKHGSCIKGPSTMSVGLKRLVKKRYTTLLIDEYNTSKKCCHCWEDIGPATINGKKLFRLLECKHGIGSPEDEPYSMPRLFLTRDKNSCINMLAIVKHLIYENTRPEAFKKITI